MPASSPLMSAQSGERVMSSLFFATPRRIRLAAVKGTKCASVVQLRYQTEKQQGQYEVANGNVVAITLLVVM